MSNSKPSYKLGDEVKHNADSCPFVVVGIRADQIEITGDWSGGIMPCDSPSWVDIDEVEPFKEYTIRTAKKTEAIGFAKWLKNLDNGTTHYNHYTKKTTDSIGFSPSDCYNDNIMSVEELYGLYVELKKSGKV
jgi:hypothetical protein